MARRFCRRRVGGQARRRAKIADTSVDICSRRPNTRLPAAARTHIRYHQARHGYVPPFRAGALRVALGCDNLRKTRLGTFLNCENLIRIRLVSLSGDQMSHSEVAELVLLYFILPLWLAAGFADYLCHRASRIEITSGYKESLIHLLMFSEVAVPLLAAIFFEINALVIATMITAFIAHQLTALWDVTFANEKRQVTPIEQQVHSFLELMPLIAILIVIILNWSQFLILWGLGPEAGRYRVVLKPDPLPWTYVLAFLSAVLIFEVLPYLEELVRGLRARMRGMTASSRGQS